MDGLSAKDICAILKACKEANVNSFTFGDLEVDFGAKEEANDYHIHLADKFLDQKTYQATEDQKPTEDEINMQMAIENPVMWEKMELGEVTDANV